MDPEGQRSIASRTMEMRQSPSVDRTEIMVIILMMIAVRFNLKMWSSNPSKVKSDLIKLRQCGMKRTSKVSLKGLIVSR